MPPDHALEQSDPPVVQVRQKRKTVQEGLIEGVFQKIAALVREGVSERAFVGCHRWGVLVCMCWPWNTAVRSGHLHLGMKMRGGPIMQWN